MHKVSFVGAVLVLLAFAGTATGALGKAQVLRYKGDGEHFYFWNVGPDSPNDLNDKGFEVSLIESDTQPNPYLVAYSRASMGLGEDVADVKNLSFEFMETLHVEAGAPRLRVQFQNGDFADLSAYNCNHPMASSDQFGRADFTRFRNNCTIFVTGETGGQYDADGTRDVWQVYADAHPEQVLEQVYFVADELGSYRIDRLSLGAGKMYQRGGNTAKTCTTEASC